MPEYLSLKIATPFFILKLHSDFINHLIGCQLPYLRNSECPSTYFLTDQKYLYQRLINKVHTFAISHITKFIRHPWVRSLSCFRTVYCNRILLVTICRIDIFLPLCFHPLHPLRTYIWNFLFLSAHRKVSRSVTSWKETAALSSGSSSSQEQKRSKSTSSFKSLPIHYFLGQAFPDLSSQEWPDLTPSLHIS